MEINYVYLTIVLGTLASFGYKKNGWYSLMFGILLMCILWGWR